MTTFSQKMDEISPFGKHSLLPMNPNNLMHIQNQRKSQSPANKGSNSKSQS